MTLPAETEADFQRWVIATAILYGWHVVHYRPARVGRGRHTRYVTPLQGHKGAPDLLLARGGVVMLRELKTDTGRVSTEQGGWLVELGDLGGIWRPRDRARIIEELRRPRARRSGAALSPTTDGVL